MSTKESAEWMKAKQEKLKNAPTSEKSFNVRVTVEIIVSGEDVSTYLMDDEKKRVEAAAKEFVEEKLRPQWSHVQKCEVVHERLLNE